MSKKWPDVSLEFPFELGSVIVSFDSYPAACKNGHFVPAVTRESRVPPCTRIKKLPPFLLSSILSGCIPFLLDSSDPGSLPFSILFSLPPAPTTARNPHLPFFTPCILSVYRTTLQRVAPGATRHFNVQLFSLRVEQSEKSWTGLSVADSP